MKYSKRSLHFAWISLIIASLFLILSQISRDSSTQWDGVVSYLITFQYMSILIGFTMAMLGWREEKTKAQRWAFFMNVLLFMALAAYFLGTYIYKMT
ncbi:hypothetical protein [Nonlabens sp.]|uniref:hypothetical protein n=1 Tax=Nonlabens sp. TaxID=1888209 RepID=UPI003F69F5CB